MVLSWTRKNVFRRARKGKEQVSGGDLEVEIAIPTHFRCPVSLDLMKDPVTLQTGITYDRGSIEKWVEAGNKTCPVTNQVLTTFDMIPNHTIRRMIQDWCVENSSYGIERIPTPRIPISGYEVSEICSKMLSASQRGDDNKCQELVAKIKALGRESERNKRCIVGNGAGAVFATAFDSFSRDSIHKHVVILEEILEVLTWMIPLGEEGQSKLGSAPSLHCMVWFLESKDLAARQNAALLLKEVGVEELAKIEGIVEGLMKIVREPIGSTAATKACLVTIFKLVSSAGNREAIAKRFVELGLVSLLLETIVEAEKGICEKALGVLDCICDCKEGKEVAQMNALTLPLVVKKILRVSQLASNFAVSVLRKICDKREEEILIEALQVGAFQKLLVMLQVGCDESTKENATELLKLLNGYKSRAECVDSSLDFKYLKKPF
ncbi:Zinc finger, RING/FYVE/PHD-type [Sesbania bispinosa]|nr:Zinc finger, RING/FYVE/PHD-type [Sesbania bispinosa]